MAFPSVGGGVQGGQTELDHDRICYFGPFSLYKALIHERKRQRWYKIETPKPACFLSRFPLPPYLLASLLILRSVIAHTGDCSERDTISVTP
jgi:hypothetical protein